MTTCRKALAQLARVKEKILRESRAALESQENLVRLALNEAESLASQTGYAHLVFPMLAVEKVQAVSTWNARQQANFGRG